MSKKVFFLIIVVAVAVLIGLIGYNLVTNNKKTKVAVTSCSNLGAKVTVRITAAGFSPREVTLKKCDKVEWVNEDKDGHWPASDPHPTHEFYPEFDPRQTVGAGETWAFTFSKLGVWTYHDHLNPTLNGTITVVTS